MKTDATMKTGRAAALASDVEAAQCQAATSASTGFGRGA
jgi:hypothetical protein